MTPTWSIVAWAGLLGGFLGFGTAVITIALFARPRSDESDQAADRAGARDRVTALKPPPEA